MKNQICKFTGNQNGIALALALIMLVVMSLIGVMTLNTTETELKIAANYGRSQATVADATSIVAYAQTNGRLFNEIGIGTISLTDGNPATVRDGSVDTLQDDFEADIAGLGGGLRMREFDEAGAHHPEWNQVEYLATGPLPRSTGTQVNAEDSGFVGRYYLISTTVEEARGGGAVTRVESQLVRVVPR